MKNKPIVISEKIREPMVKIMYLLLFMAIGFTAWFLYWTIYVENFFKISS